MDPPPGFADAPLSKAMFVTTVVATLAAIVNGTDPSLDVTGLLAGKVPIWRLLPALASYGDLLDLSTGLYLTHAMRVIERQMGSGRYGAFLFLATPLALSLQVALYARWPRLPPPAPGPLPLLSAALTLYYGFVPSIGLALQARPNGWCIAKARVYTAAALLLLKGGISSFLPALAGATAAVLCMTDALPLHRFRLPRIVRRTFGLLEPLLRSESPKAAQQRRMLERQRMMSRRGAGGGGGERLLPPTGPGRPAAAAAATWASLPPPPPPSEEAIGVLEGLGFDRDSAINALKATRNNVDAAANRLLGQ